MITITSLSKNDLNGLKILYDTGFQGLNTDILKMNENYELIKDNPNYIVLCAKNEGKIVGSLIGIINIDFKGSCKPFMIVENVIVSEECRRMGIGNSLMASIEKVAIEKGCSFIMLVTGMHRTWAQKFYESVGFKGDIVKGYKKFFQ
ncbi:GNAT family N-acetyltransferase [Clostridium sp. CS001]|uniref:GNAT family N-acetyltransferase n=1 Tax=Clostridium sp. CS001 TaxID=2880648 RepID=UPI001CF52C2E|nr:GNAT family N-acetyltransferase [Clostridium sp. CS001]MCB2290876.1 GNAT family N-acetyltransferase [Clostridium sp. CS001]